MTSRKKKIKAWTQVGSEKLLVVYHYCDVVGATIYVWTQIDGNFRLTQNVFDDSSYKHLPPGKERNRKFCEERERRRAVAYQAIRQVFILPDETLTDGLNAYTRLRYPYLDDGEYHHADPNAPELQLRLPSNPYSPS
jgi:hypothetical protein